MNLNKLKEKEYLIKIKNILKNEKDFQLFLENKIGFYIKKRKLYLKKRKYIYNDSNIITFQDKINWLIIHESPEYKSNLVDKIKLHKYSKKVLGKDICVPIIKIYDDINKIKLNELPNKFVLKLNHGSGMNIICNNKSSLNLTKIKLKLSEWKAINYGLLKTEFQYMYVNRKIFVEKYLGDDLIDYKIFCFNGKPKFVRIRKFIPNNKTKIHNHYDINWKLNSLERKLQGYIRDPNVKIDKPKTLNLMLKYATKLAKEFVFVRVDLYEVNNTVYLGELTFSPTNSLIHWKNMEQNLEFANLMDLTKIKKYLYNK